MLTTILLYVILIIFGVICVAGVAILIKKNTELQNKIAVLQQELSDSENEAKGLQLKEVFMRQAEQERKNAEDSMKLAFENLSHKILEQSSQKLKQESQESITNLLNPFKEDWQKFKNKVEEVYNTEGRERYSLQNEIVKLMEATGNTNKAATNLSNALSNDKKTQGNWGEIQLENILQQSGLQPTIDYTLQYSVKDSMGKQFYLDALINLPESKQMVIDSKVSLINYQKCHNEEDKMLKDSYRGMFIEDIKNQIKNLSSKSYFSMVNSVDFVLMFMPIESAYSFAIQVDPSLHQLAWKNNIILCSSATLFGVLRSVSYIRKLEAQNKNSQEIAKTGSELYDNFAILIEKYSKVEQQLNTAVRSFDDMGTTLHKGRGSLLTKVKKMELLGIKSSKGKHLRHDYINEDLLDNDIDEDLLDNEIAEKKDLLSN